jgi:hypothetical protein
VFGPVGPGPADHRDDLSLPGVFNAASRTEGFEPHDGLRRSLVKAAATYLDSYEDTAQARAVEAVQSFLHDVHSGKAKGDPAVVLGGHLAEVMAKATRDVKRLVETETSTARNTGILDGMTKVNTLAGVSDPVVFFVTVSDHLRCRECTKLHLLDDGTTPRLWKLSEVESGYHKRGSGHPSVKGLHPHCRCSLTSLLPGFGFNSSGMVTYVSVDFDAYADQMK